MAGDIKNKLATTVALTVTNLHSLASSQTWVGGWGSLGYANTTNLYDDYLYGGTFTTHASNRQAGTIEVWVIASLNDTPTYFTTATGTPATEGAITFTAREQLLSMGRLLTAITVTNTASQIYAFPQTGIKWLFNGRVPSHHYVFVTQNASTTTTAGLAAAGSVIHHTPVYDQYT